MGYIPWYERMAQEKAEREVKKKAPTKQDNVVNKVLEEKPRFQYDPISEELQDVNAPGWAEKATKQMDDIKKKPLVAKHTETKSPELSGVDRYILAKKI
jgi:hypothetical protein